MAVPAVFRESLAHQIKADYLGHEVLDAVKRMRVVLQDSVPLGVLISEVSVVHQTAVMAIKGEVVLINASRSYVNGNHLILQMGEVSATLAHDPTKSAVDMA